MLNLASLMGSIGSRVEQIDIRYAADTALQRNRKLRDVSTNGIYRTHARNDNPFFLHAFF